MQNLYERFICRLKYEHFPDDVVYLQYFNLLSDSEIYTILQYDSYKFKKYVNLIYKLENYKNICGCYFGKLREITKMIFDNNSKNSKELQTLLLNTDIFDNLDVVEFSAAFLALNDKIKAKAILEILLDNSYIYRRTGNLMKILTTIRSMKTSYQVNLVENLIAIPGVIGSSKFYQLIDLIKENDHCKFLSYIPIALKNYSLLKHHDMFRLITFFLDVKNKEQADILLKAITNSELLKSTYSLNKTIDFILFSNNRHKLKYLKFLLNDKISLPKRLVEILKYLESAKYDFQEEAIMTIVSRYKNFAYNTYQFDLIMRIILSTNKEFQTNSFLRFLKNVDHAVLENSSVLIFLDNLSQTKYDFQAFTILSLLQKAFVNEYFKKHLLDFNNGNINSCNYALDIIHLINTINNKDACLGIMSVLKINYLLEKPNCMEILKKYVSLTTVEQMMAFSEIISKPNFLNSKSALQILSYFKLANKYQLIALKTIILRKNNYDELVENNLLKYVLISDNPEIISYITALILAPSVDLKEVEKSIQFVLDNQKAPEIIQSLVFDHLPYFSYLREIKNLIGVNDLSLVEKVKYKIKNNKK